MEVPTIRTLFDFDDRVLCVTGGAGGIGSAVGETFASLGAAVALADVDADGVEGAARHLEAAHDVPAIPVPTDVTSLDDARAMVDTVEDALGPIDVLVNNAGVAIDGPFVESDPADWETVIGVALFGTLHCTHAVLPTMVERGRGSIVNFASGAYHGNDPGLAVYGAAKAANVSFTKSLAREVGGAGVRVNCVSPGTVRTPATEAWLDASEDEVVESYALGRVGEPTDVANAVAVLASDATDWVTGEVLHVDGGYARR